MTISPSFPGYRLIPNHDSGKFVLKVLAPVERKGVYEYKLDEIESVKEKG